MAAERAPWPDDPEIRRKLKRQCLALVHTLDELMGDTDLDGDDSPEFRASQACVSILEKMGVREW